MLVPPFFSDAPSTDASSLYALAEIPRFFAEFCAHECICPADCLKTESTAPTDCSISPAALIESFSPLKIETPAKSPPPASNAFLKTPPNTDAEDFAALCASSSALLKASLNPARACDAMPEKPRRNSAPILPNRPLVRSIAPVSSSCDVRVESSAL